MALVDVNWKPSDRQLRQFAGLALVVLPVAAWLWSGNPRVVAWFAIAGVAVFGIGMAFPKAIRPVYLGLLVVALPIGIVVGETFLLSIYFGLFLPMGLVFRLLGRRPLQLSFDRQSPTYWQAKAQPSGPAQYYRQS